VFFKRYRNTTLVDHLGNLFGSIRIQKHHLIESKRPRTPLKLPHLRYRTGSLRELRVIFKFDFKLAKGPNKRKSGVFIGPLPFIQLGQASHKRETNAKINLN